MWVELWQFRKRTPWKRLTWDHGKKSKILEKNESWITARRNACMWYKQGMPYKLRVSVGVKWVRAGRIFTLSLISALRMGGCHSSQSLGLKRWLQCSQEGERAKLRLLRWEAKHQRWRHPVFRDCWNLTTILWERNTLSINKSSSVHWQLY